RRGAQQAQAREGAHYAYAGDLRLLRTLERLRPVKMALEATVRLWRSAARAELLAGAVKATQREQATVHALGERCAERLHIAAPTIYVAPNNRAREAHTLGTDDEHYVVLSGGLVDELTEAELGDVIGRQCGKIQNQHVLPATAHLVDDTTKKIDPKKLGDWVTIEGKEASHVKYVEVGWPAEILKDKVTLVDTPGVNDINEQRAEITYGYIPRADAVLFLLDGAQVLKQSERAFLEQRILRRSKDKIIFILGKVDLLAPDEREEALKYCRDHLARVVDEPQIFPVSAKRQLSDKEADRAQSGFAPLLAHLQRYLADERGRVLLDNAVNDGLRTGGYLASNLGIKRRSLELALEELEERIGRVHKQLDSAQSRLKLHHAKIRAEADAIKAGMRIDLEQFVREFEVRLPQEIDRADGEEVKRYLGPFIQDTWKAWAEGEGEKIAAQLERLAEEIIQVTNEDVAAAMATLSRELGPADTKIDLEVDTLKYDVGVFALGALGTGIFLF
ncbi:MAG: dynamin family protein, partial [Myxococcales bacterium]|nr:dynamin family protein [Myxococcales bacterium]